MNLYNLYKTILRCRDVVVKIFGRVTRAPRKRVES